MADTNTGPAPRASAESLRGRLPEIPAAGLQPLREFFQRPQHWLLQDNGLLRFGPGAPAPAAETFELDAEGTRLGLRLQAPPARDDAPHWSDYAGRARVLAWSLAHEPWLVRLSDTFGVALTPLPDASADDAGAPQVWLDFLIEDDDAEARVPGAALAQGSLRAPLSWLPRLLAQAAPPYADDPPTPLGRWTELPVRLRLVLSVPPLPARDWNALRPGDVVLIGRRSAPPPVEAHGAGLAWPLAATTQGWRVQGPAHPIPRFEETASMSEQDTPPENAADAPEAAEAGPRALPVRLSFEVGAIDLRVGELAELQPGYVFALPVHLEGANVVLRANGEAVGQGELVAVGDTLGVRLIAWH
ncbi:type III secretion system cytoplasmic ring protein SctQ [Luteimonas sp. Y-2-2-4F]|nr:type III secretion system cytoplasmic ring protein SctQ [Luteimonas sp. Y-2-2-4F]MCD9032372.1 type III secretion system cytoplasmic ring protein SctQ [Luteimonas sp. Y-2-2-4F]